MSYCIKIYIFHYISAFSRTYISSTVDDVIMIIEDLRRALIPGYLTVGFPSPTHHLSSDVVVNVLFRTPMWPQHFLLRLPIYI
jgi:hypothetical protein